MKGGGALGLKWKSGDYWRTQAVRFSRKSLGTIEEKSVIDHSQ